MKKNYFILSLALLIAPFCSQAQVVNGNFENVKPNFLPSNWGMNFLQQFGFDENGNPIGDQIQFTWCFPSMVYASFESKSGQYAMEVSNAFNLTQNVVIPGMATLFENSEEDSPGWNPGIPVDPNSSIILLGFDYKFLPVGNDVAEATLQVVDANGNELGKASLDISGVHNTYTYVYTPIAVTQAGTPAFMYISFNMAKAGSTPTFGTRLLVDNVVVNFSALIVDEHSQGAKVYPTLADNELNIVPNGFSESVSYKIINSEGKIIKQNTVNQNSNYVYTMDVSDLSAGIYFLNIQDETKNSTKKFIKK
ncbi:T9SS type A sorting domain-containing protein [Flavobacterium sp. AS60]|uniref:T9SS type A sorting domain-containing protein n=1 Tax=Flavobacterium anseongense TaxID=2910677 RepID=UPI001F44B619|nr:T9SS type A sorting domain-containing protein [Flavobacterium sp. AS60]MCF6128919.1 T9SS type A sorting domain-containing protein [Flavobacterium sp. AS60]